MPNTYTQFNMHIVFSVKNRENFLTDKIRPELFKYIHGIINNKKHYPLAVNGYKDHVHIFFEFNPAFSYSKSQRDTVIKYITNQEEHHKEKTFKEEYLKLLNDFGIEFKNEYLFEFYDE